MACSPDGSQSVWKRTLSAALAGDAKECSAKAAAIKPNARVTSFIGDLLTRHGSGARGLSRPSRAPKINTLRRRGRRAVHTIASFRAGKDSGYNLISRFLPDFPRGSIRCRQFCRRLTIETRRVTCAL